MILVLACVAFLSGFITVLVQLFKQRAEMIDPSKCDQIKLCYGVSAGMSSPPISICGSTGSTLCRFDVSSLSDAIGTCDDDDKCTDFTLSNGIMEYTSPTGGRSIVPGFDLYVYQCS
jgi:hypothetical protein